MARHLNDGGSGARSPGSSRLPRASDQLINLEKLDPLRVSETRRLNRHNSTDTSMTSHPMKDFPVAVGPNELTMNALPFHHRSTQPTRRAGKSMALKAQQPPRPEAKPPYGLPTGMPAESAELMHPYPGGRAYKIAESR
jgi:hypothetical protein